MAGPSYGILGAPPPPSYGLLGDLGQPQRRGLLDPAALAGGNPDAPYPVQIPSYSQYAFGRPGTFDGANLPPMSIGGDPDRMGVALTDRAMMPEWLNNLETGATYAMPEMRLAKPALAMDAASRMARAREMGFRTDQPVFHGSASPDITAFDLGRGGATSGSAVGRMGVSVALDPAVAEEFAQAAAKKSGGNAQTYPLLARKSKAAAIRLSGDEKNNEIAATLGDAWDKGYDAVLLRNYTTPGGKTGADVLIVKDPAQLRSPAAAFDPAKRNSPDIMGALDAPRPAAA